MKLALVFASIFASASAFATQFDSQFATEFAPQVTCKITVSDRSDIGREEGAQARVVKSGSSTETVTKKGADLFYSLPSDPWHNYQTFNVSARVDAKGKILSADVSDEIKDVQIPMAISSNGKEAKLTYSHGGVLGAQEMLEVQASCEVK